MATTKHPIDLEFSLLRATYADEDVATIRAAVVEDQATTRQCRYCKGPGVYKGGTWAGFCSRLCWHLFVEDRR